VWRRRENLLEEHDAVEIEMVGRLVEDQQVGLERQGASDRDPFSPASGERADATVERVETEPSEGASGAPVAIGLGERQGGERVEDRRLDRRLEVERRVLLDEGDARAFADRSRPRVGLFEPGDDPEQRRFSGAVRPDETDPVAGADAEGDPGEERSGAELLGDRIAGEKRRGSYNATSRRSRMSALPSAISARAASEGAPTR
jgi:hypothetical protein